MGREYPLQTRIDEGLFRRLKAAADANLRSVSAEAYLRLKASFAGEERGTMASDGGRRPEPPQATGPLAAPNPAQGRDGQ